MRSYSVRDVQRVLQLAPDTTRSLIRAGFVHPARGPRREYRFSFQDLIVLRTARALLDARILRPLRFGGHGGQRERDEDGESEQRAGDDHANSCVVVLPSLRSRAIFRQALRDPRGAARNACPPLGQYFP